MTRLFGLNRYETATAVSADQFSSDTFVVFVATGANFPDALAGGPPAALADGPVLLVSSSGVPETTAAELTRLSPDAIVILGGVGAVSDDIAQELQGHLTP